MGMRKVVLWGAAAALILGCSERDRLTFPTSVDGLGPAVTITDPGQDTTVVAGPAALVTGRVVDQDGIDTVYFDVQGGVSSFSPFIANGDDTVNFQLPITTNGLSGTTITVAVSGVNLAGLVGDTALRQITIQ
jgi:hypothetical protein